MIQTLRLAQFFRLRVAPLLERFPNVAFASESRALFTAEFFEMVGWLNEGVFCGFFDPKDADVLWVRISTLKEYCGSPSHNLVAPIIATEIERLYRTDYPFHSSTLMPDGAQKRFELPLFQEVLHLSDRWADDSLATECSSFLVSNEISGINIENPDMPVEHSAVASAQNTGEPTGLRLEDLLAGFIQTLQHMDESRSFFKNAHYRSHRTSDFDSYRQRVGSLNAWRVPLLQRPATKKIDQLFYLLEFALRTSTREAAAGIEWSSFEQPLRSSFQSLMECWENDHFLSYLEPA
jgi:hypothetical protein